MDLTAKLVKTHSIVKKKICNNISRLFHIFEWSLIVGLVP